MSKSRLIFAPHAPIARGFSQMGSLMSAVLGPEQGVIWNAIGTGKPESLTDAGVIARRVIEVAGDCENIGAMILRQAAMAMHERYLDGASITGTLAAAMLEGAQKLIAAGVNPMLLRRGIEQGVKTACAKMRADALPADSQTALENVANTAIRDPELAAVLSEMFDLLGSSGAYVVEEYAAPLIDRAYVEGGRWSARPASRDLMPPGGADLTLENPLIFVSDDKIERIEQIRPAVEMAVNLPDKPPLLIIARELSGEALKTLTINHVRGAITAAGVMLLSSGEAMREDLEDISMIVGAALAAQAIGTAPEMARPSWLGRARQVIVGRDTITLISGAGDRAVTARRASELRARLRAIREPNDQWERLRLRIARLSGGLGILKIGALTFQERDLKKALAKKAVRVLETALEGGVLPGGGTAYLNAIAAVESARHNEESAGLMLVAHALRAPLLQLVHNHGELTPSVVLHDVMRMGGDAGFNVRTGKIGSMREAGLLDSAPILCAALETAASAAIMAMTTDVVIAGK